MTTVRRFAVTEAGLARIVEDWRRTLGGHTVNRAVLILVDPFGAEITNEDGVVMRFTVRGQESRPVLTRETATAVYEARS